MEKQTEELDDLEALQKVLGIGDMCRIECPYCNQDIDLEELCFELTKGLKEKKQ